VPWLLLVAGLATIGADRLTKRLVGVRPAGWSRDLAPGIALRHVVTRLRDSRDGRRTWLMPMIFLAASAYLTVLVVSGSFFHAPSGQLGVGLAIAGAASNLHDRIRYARTVDFISIGAWPTFNVADIGIVIGAILAALNLR
jgi:hypothetical protein